MRKQNFSFSSLLQSIILVSFPFDTDTVNTTFPQQPLSSPPSPHPHPPRKIKIRNKRPPLLHNEIILYLEFSLKKRYNPKMEILHNKDEMIKRFGRFYKKGTILFREGDEGNKMFIIHKGKVKVFRTIKGIERVLAVFEKGEFFGEMAIFTKRPRSASIEVIEDSILIELTEDQLLDFIKEEPSIGLKMLSVMAKRLENSNKLVENLILKDERTQSVNALIQVSEEMERLGKSGDWFRFDPNSFIARAGVTPEIAKRVLAVIRKMGFIDVKGKNIRIVNPTKLKEFINFLFWTRTTTQ